MCPSPNVRARRFLVVDDDKDSRQFLQRLFERRGHEVRAAGTGLEAKALVETFRPDLVVSDIFMPDMDGFELAMWLKSGSDFASIPIVFYTATYIEPEDRQLAQDLGVSEFLVKPTLPEVLARTIEGIADTAAVSPETVPRSPLRPDAQLLDSHAARVRAKLDHKQVALTALQQRLDALEARASETDALLTLTPEAAMVLSRNGRVLAVNPALTALTGYAPGELEGRDVALLSDGQSGSSGTFSWPSFLASVPANATIWLLHKSGRRLQAQIALQPVADSAAAEGELIATVTNPRRRISAAEDQDPVTGLSNRAAMESALRDALASNQDDSSRFAVLFLDIDHFQHANDSYGHAFGDKVLRESARRIERAIRDDDLVSRLSGDEFLVLMPYQGGVQGPARLAERISNAFTAPFVGPEGQVFLSVSIGIALLPEDGADTDSLLRNADTAMFKAKEQGRGRHVFYDPKFTEALQRNLALASDLRLAFQKGQFELFYQPQWRIEPEEERPGGREIVACEALVRWRHPGKGLIPPLEFITIAEQSDIILALGDWILEQACADAARWQETRIAVNVSAIQLLRGDLQASVERALAKSGLAPERLEIEITESFFVERTAATIATLESLRSRGVGVAIDDFGTGYSSLSYLKGLPANLVKIDQSFVRNLTTDWNDRAIVKAIIAMSSDCGRLRKVSRRASRSAFSRSRAVISLRDICLPNQCR